MLERMDLFFESRLHGYDDHMLQEIEGAQEFYPYTAACLPIGCVNILDLGCGTGLELEWYFHANPSASVTGIDLSAGMLNALRDKFLTEKLTLIRGSYFDVSFGESVFDAAVSVESLHHFTMEEKIPLYAKLHHSLKEGGYFILTDYFAPSSEEEQLYQREYVRMRKEQKLEDGLFYHYDTPLTVEHEIEALKTAGFGHVEILRNWAATFTLKAFY